MIPQKESKMKESRRGCGARMMLLVGAVALTACDLSGDPWGAEPPDRADEGVTAPGESPDEASGGVIRLALKRLLPRCTPLRRGQVYYIESEEQFYYCNGVYHVRMDFSGEDGEDGSSCTVADNGDGTATIVCEDGTTAIIDPEAGYGSLLIETEEEPPGENCLNGGDAIHVGYDLDDSGDLDAQEIASTTYRCDDEIVCGGDVTITTDAEAVAFGAKGCRLLIGSLDIREDVTTLAPLYGLVSITDDLAVRHSDLVDLDGLQSLTRVEGNIDIGVNYNLTNLNGLDNLDELGGSLRLIQNNISSVEGLGSLAGIGGDLYLYDNNGLANLIGLDNLAYIGGVLKLDRANLINLSGLESLTYINGLYVRMCNELEDLTGLETLSEIGEIGVYIAHSGGPQTLDGLESLTRIDGYLSISENYIMNIDGLRNLYSVGGNVTLSQLRVSDLSGLARLHSVEGSMALVLNSLESLTGLENLYSVEGSLSITSNDLLTSLAGLDELYRVAGDLRIRSNHSLPQCEVDNAVAGIPVIGGSVSSTPNGNTDPSLCD